MVRIPKTQNPKIPFKVKKISRVKSQKYFPKAGPKKFKTKGKNWNNYEKP